MLDFVDHSYNGDVFTNIPSRHQGAIKASGGGEGRRRALETGTVQRHTFVPLPHALHALLEARHRRVSPQLGSFRLAGG